MRSLDLAPPLLHRLRRPVTWGIALLFGAAWVAVRLLLDLPLGRLGWGEVAVPLVLLLGTLVLSPVPWQWTGDERPTAPFLRGLLQALPWNALWLTLLLAAAAGLGMPLDGPSGDLLPDFRRPAPPPPRAEAPPMPPPGPPPGPAPGPPPRPGGVLLGLLNLPLAVVLGWFLADQERASASEAQARGLAREAQARALQAQMNPHVLFNALSGLSELVHEDADAAEEALVELSQMLRLLLQHVTEPSLPLRKERELLKSYLTLEQIRLGSRLRVAWEWPDWADRLMLPPLLLQPLVENAVKHGISMTTNGGQLRIEVLRREGGDLVLRVANTGLMLQELRGRRGGGMGLRNLRERLALIHPRARLELREEDYWTLAEITIPKEAL